MGRVGEDERAAQVEAVRRFSRMYTRRIGVLAEGLLGSPHSLVEARVIYELAQRRGVRATDLAAVLELDRGFLSRVLKRLERRGLVHRRPSARDGRVKELRLSPSGRRAFRGLDAASRRQIADLLSQTSDHDRRRLVQAMERVQAIVEPTPSEAEVGLRGPRPGDLGWVVERHGALYHAEYGWSVAFEALVATIVAEFARRFDERAERCWIAERAGERVGSVFLIRKTKATAQLRLLLVEPHARGLGIGRRLVRACTAFARETGYRRIVLWTNDVLYAARRSYEGEGYQLTEEEPHRSFGHALTGQHWALDLPPATARGRS
ncbi:MAG: GNAT family N-acetyltransferase [Sandaracinaceae bacterium]